MSQSDNETIQEENTEAYEPKNEIEAKAMERGWNPEHLYEGDKADWVDAKEFVFRGQLMDEISKKSRKVKQLEQDVNKFKGYMQKVEQEAFQRAKEALLLEQAEALSEGDTLKAVQKGEELRQLDYKTQTAQVNSRTEWDEEFDVWVQDNRWYEQDPARAAYAERIVVDYVRSNPNATPAEAYDYVTREVRKEFKHKFSNPNRSSAGDVAPSNMSGNSRATGKTGLTPEEIEAADTFIKAGLFSSYEEYKKELKGL